MKILPKLFHYALFLTIITISLKCLGKYYWHFMRIRPGDWQVFSHWLRDSARYCIWLKNAMSCPSNCPTACLEFLFICYIVWYTNSCFLLLCTFNLLSHWNVYKKRCACAPTSQKHSKSFLFCHCFTLNWAWWKFLSKFWIRTVKRFLYLQNKYTQITSI